MKRFLLFLSIICLALSNNDSVAQTNTIRIFDTVLFYDGYKQLSIIPLDAPVDSGVTRLKTSLYTTKIKPSQLAQIGNKLTLNVYIKAACDNYDRGGHVTLAFVPKGDTSYSTSKVARIEIARFITPFMNKNKKPNVVPYTYNIDNVASILKERKVIDNFDIWCELEVFGVSSAAQTQVTGCTGRFDVFYGTVDFVTDTIAAPLESDNYILSLGNQLNFNNYKVGASDSVGTTIKTIKFTLDETTNDSKLYLITSNHGANSGGEEYIRRDHFVYIDNILQLQYIPGFKSCEPYRKYNTQSNGIYGSSVKSDAAWQSFSNWCPGAYIPIREIALGKLEAGVHTFRIEVPDAEFVASQGNFPLSLYFQGKSSSKAITLKVDEFEGNLGNTFLFPNPAINQITIQADNVINKVSLLDVLGNIVSVSNQKTLDISDLSSGIYFAKIEFSNKQEIVKKFMK